MFQSLHCCCFVGTVILFQFTQLLKGIIDEQQNYHVIVWKHTGCLTHLISFAQQHYAWLNKSKLTFWIHSLLKMIIGLLISITAVKGHFIHFDVVFALITLHIHTDPSFPLLTFQGPPGRPGIPGSDGVPGPPGTILMLPVSPAASTCPLSWQPQYSTVPQSVHIRH